MVEDMKNKGIQRSIERAGGQRQVAEVLSNKLGERYTQQSVSRLLNQIRIQVDVAYVLAKEYGLNIEDFLQKNVAA